MYPRWRTTKMYSKPSWDLTGKRPVRSADDQSALVMVLARDHLARGGLTGARGGEGREGEEHCELRIGKLGGVPCGWRRCFVGGC